MSSVAVLALAHYRPFEPDLPPLVTDDAGLMDAPARRRLDDYHRRLLQDHQIDYRVVTRAAADDLDRFAHDTFRDHEVGALGGRGRGLLLVLDPMVDRVRLEVGASLEGIYTDAFVAYLEHRQMVPFFRTGRIADGIMAASELIVERAQRAAAGGAFDPDGSAAFSLGGGAAADARIGTGADDSFARATSDARPGSSPEGTVDAYLDAMRARNGRPDLALYSRATRALLEDWIMTPAQMDAIGRLYASCGQREARYGPEGRRVVLRYPIEQRQCSPWLLVREAGAWRLDLASAQGTFRFNHRNEWRLVDPEAAGFGFGFIDWRFDAHGFPIERR